MLLRKENRNESITSTRTLVKNTHTHTKNPNEYAHCSKKFFAKADVDSKEYREVSKWVNIKWRIIHICAEVIPPRNWTSNLLHPKAGKLSSALSYGKGLLLDCDLTKSGAPDRLQTSSSLWRPPIQKTLTMASHVLLRSKETRYIQSQPVPLSLQSVKSFSLMPWCVKSYRRTESK